MENENNKSNTFNKILTAIIIALLAGGTSPWWWNEFFKKDSPSPNQEERTIQSKKQEEFTPSIITILCKDVFNDSSTSIMSIPNDISRIVKTMKSDPEWNVEISVHTDNFGDFNANKRLSEERANSIKEYFLQQDIGTERIKSEGKGSQKPLAGNNTIKGKELNRRIEFALRK